MVHTQYLFPDGSVKQDPVWFAVWELLVFEALSL